MAIFAQTLHQYPIYTTLKILNEIVSHFINFLAEIPKLPVGRYVNVLTKIIKLIFQQVSLARKFLFCLCFSLSKVLQNMNYTLLKFWINVKWTKVFVRQNLGNFDLVRKNLSQEIFCPTKNLADETFARRIFVRLGILRHWWVFL